MRAAADVAERRHRAAPDLEQQHRGHQSIFHRSLSVFFGSGQVNKNKPPRHGHIFEELKNIYRFSACHPVRYKERYYQNTRGESLQIMASL